MSPPPHTQKIKTTAKQKHGDVKQQIMIKCNAFAAYNILFSVKEFSIPVLVIFILKTQC